MNKITFKLDTDFDLELEFILIGISSSLREYRLCHFINKHTGLKFTYGKEDYVDHNGDLKGKPKEELDYHIVFEKTKNKKEIIHHFPTYRYCNINFDFEFYIINNRSVENGYLLPEAPNFDYFMIIKHFIDEEDLDALLDNLKKVNDIFLVKEIDPITLKSKENLIF